MKYAIKQTGNFSEWLDGLEDGRAQGRIAARLDALALGNFGDWKPIEAGLCELRIDYGPGYRVYYGQAGQVLMLIIGGGIKRTQKRDIARALALWKEAKEVYNDRQKN
jgi:putative addiction module killer protein